MSDDQQFEVAVEPRDGLAGVGVVREPNAGGPIAEYQVLQIWPNGEADAVHVGDKAEARALLDALREVLDE